MAKITNEMVHQAYEVSRKVYQGTLSRTDGKNEIVQLSGMGASSAGDYITNFLAMIEGKRYVRVMNLYATEYFLIHIGLDYGREAQKRAARAVSAHVKYYETVQSYLRSTDELAKRYM